MFSKCDFVVTVKDKKGTTIANAIQSILDDSKRKLNKTWVDQGSKVYNTHFKKWLKDNNIEMYSTHNEGKYLEPYDNLKKYIIKANPNNSIFEEVNNFNQTSKSEIDENILLYFDL